MNNQIGNLQSDQAVTVRTEAQFHPEIPEEFVLYSLVARTHHQLLRVMGNAPFMQAPDTEKDFGDGETTYGAYGFSSMQGWRTGQEDAHSIAGERSLN